MMLDHVGQTVLSEQDIVDLLYLTPNLNLTNLLCIDPERYNSSCAQLHLDLPRLAKYEPYTGSLEDYDRLQQNNWLMPLDYKNFDIAKFLLDQCQTPAELQRVGEELLLYQERNLFDLLNYLKYLVDVMREHKIVWGVGRGSSVSSYVLYLLGVHRINSIYYDLDIKEFLKD